MSGIENTFQGGTPGASVIASASGGASGTAFDGVVIGAGSTLAYFMKTPVTRDSMWALLTPAANQLTYVHFLATQIGSPAPTESYQRIEVELTGYPASGQPIGITRVVDGSATTMAGLNIDNNGHLQLVKAGGAGVSTGATAIPLNTPVRIELHYILASAAAGLVEARLFLSPSATLADEVLSATTDTLGATSGIPSQYRFGMTVARTTAPAPFRFSKLAVSGNGWPGPWAPGPAAPLMLRAGVVAHGVAAEGADATFETDANRGTAIAHWFETWGNRYELGFNTSSAAAHDAEGRINLITWQPGDGTSSSTSATFNLSAIIAGDHDTHIRLWADGCAAFGKPLFVRFAHEMNGDWYQWGTKSGHNGNTAAEFVSAWQHVRAIFTARGATNVSWVFCPNRPFTGSTPMAQLYPGDSQVDWMAIDAYNGGTDNGGTWKDVATTFDAAFTELRATNSTKPVMIAETGCSENGGSKAGWLTDLFTALSSTYTYVRALVYFNLDKTGSTSNWRIETSPAATSAYAAGVANNRYGTRLSAFAEPAPPTATGRVDVTLLGAASTLAQVPRVSGFVVVRTPAAIITPSGLRFAGDPGLNNFYLGVSPNTSTVAQHELHMNAPIGMLRSYSTTGSPNWSAVDTAISGGRVPWTSWLGPPSRSYASIASGAEDAWIDSIAAGFAARAPWPIWWTLHHEPENDTSASGTNAPAYRAAQRRVRQRIKAAGVSNDTFVCCCYMTPFTWNEQASKRDWRIWYPDWKDATGLGSPASPDHNDFWVDGDPNSVVDVIGLDFYHGWDLAGLPGDSITKWLTVTGSNVWNVRYGPRSAWLGKPYAIGEWATAAKQSSAKDPDGNGTWTLSEYNGQFTRGEITFFPQDTRDWIDDYFSNHFNGTVAFCYWDSQLAAGAVVANNPLSVADPNETRWQQLGVWGRSQYARQWTG